MQKNTQELLQRITTETKCTYISDLSLLRNRECVRKVVESIPAEEYSIREWKDAAKYILGKQAEVVTQQQAKDLFGTGKF